MDRLQVAQKSSQVDLLKQFPSMLSKALTSVSERPSFIKKISKPLNMTDHSPEIEIIQQTPILTDEETPEQLYSADRNFYVNRMLEVVPLDDATFKITNFTPTDFEKVTVFMQLSDIGSPIALGCLNELKGHSQLICRYPFVKKEQSYKTDTDYRIVLGPNTRLSECQPVFEVYTDHRVFEKLQQIKVNWQIRFYHKTNQGGTDVTPQYARAYTALIPEIACIVSSDEYQDLFLKGQFGLWRDLDHLENEDGTDNTTTFSSEELKVIYENGMNFQVYRLGVLADDSGIGGTGFCTNNFARIALVKYYFSWEDDAIFETFGHEYGHAVCFPQGYTNHETNIPHLDFYKGNGGLFSKLYQQLINSDRLPFSQPGITPNVIMGFGKEFSRIDRLLDKKQLPCVLDQIDEREKQEECYLSNQAIFLDLIHKKNQEHLIFKVLRRAEFLYNKLQKNLQKNIQVSSELLDRLKTEVLFDQLFPQGEQNQDHSIKSSQITHYLLDAIPDLKRFSGDWSAARLGEVATNQPTPVVNQKLIQDLAAHQGDEPVMVSTAGLSSRQLLTADPVLLNAA
ncbi:hypothetical protein [unidentified bacterial endosymbiont]|uniref:hypothetical protein n=1 Tax=unidentified bacterial endosymbiont TaxID=2355 RepID=UPI00209EDAA4|nr:hypothetical protein [unidentified bacterial endosymbiont]